MPVKNISDISLKKVEAGRLAHTQVLIGPDEGPNFAMRRFIMESGGGIPPHTNKVEHEQYVLSGRAKIGIGDEIFEVKKDDIVFIPAGVPHWYEVVSEEPFEFLCVVPNMEDEISMVKKDD